MENTEHKKRFLLIISFISMIMLVISVLFAAGGAPVFASGNFNTRAVSTSQYSNEFYCRYKDSNNVEHYLTYNGGNAMTITNDPEDALFTITFGNNNTTVNISRGDYNLGYSGANKTYLSDTVYDWVVDHGQIKVADNDRIIMYSDNNNVARAYVGGSGYYSIYFYTQEQYYAASQHCSWDANRRAQLESLVVGETQTIHFLPGGGSGTMNDVEIPAGSIYTLPECTFIAPTGKIFKAWHDGTDPTDRHPGETITVNGETYLTAIWKTIGVEKYEAKFGSSYNSKSVGSYENSWYSTTNGFVVDIVNGNNNNNGWNYIKFGSKNEPPTGSITNNGSITTHNKIDESISSVTLTIDALTESKIDSVQLLKSADNANWTSVGFFDKEVGDQTVNITTPTNDLYYQIVIRCLKGSSNGLIQISKVTYTI